MYMRHTRKAELSVPKIEVRREGVNENIVAAGEQGKLIPPHIGNKTWCR